MVMNMKVAGEDNHAETMAGYKPAAEDKVVEVSAEEDKAVEVSAAAVEWWMDLSDFRSEVINSIFYRTHHGLLPCGHI